MCQSVSTSDFSILHESHVDFKPGDPPSFKLHPERKVSLPDEMVTFSVEAEGMKPLRYRWLRDNQLMDEAEGPVLTLTGVKEADSGNYQCQVENLLGKAVSEPAELHVGEYYQCTNSYLLTTEEIYTLTTGEIVFTDLKIFKMIGSGGFGSVWKGEWIPGKKVVAIKKVQDIVEREVGR